MFLMLAGMNCSKFLQFSTLCEKQNLLMHLCFELHSQFAWKYRSFYMMLLLEAIDNPCHDKPSILKVQAFAVIDRTIDRLTRLPWAVEKTGNFRYYLHATGDHSTGGKIIS